MGRYGMSPVGGANSRLNFESVGEALPRRNNRISRAGSRDPTQVGRTPCGRTNEIPGLDNACMPGFRLDIVIQPSL